MRFEASSFFSLKYCLLFFPENETAFRCFNHIVISLPFKIRGLHDLIFASNETASRLPVRFF